VGKTSNLPQIFKERCDSEAHNFKMAHHIDKAIADVSSMINVLKDGTKLGGIIHRVLMQFREKIDEL